MKADENNKELLKENRLCRKTRLEKLSQLYGVSGDEKEVRDFLTKEYEKRSLKIVRDRLGSVFGKRKSENSNFKVMISSNIDESGGMISDIRADGLMEFIIIGRYDRNRLEERKVKVVNRVHEKYSGNIIKKEGILLLDAGFCSLDEVMHCGIHIGDFFSLDIPVTYLSETLCSTKNLSNRAGIEAGLTILEYIGNEKMNFELFIGGISHSVTGQRGAVTAVNTVKPDLSLVIDAAYVKNYKKNTIYIRDFDKSMIPNQKLKHYFHEVTEKNGFKTEGHVQLEATDGSFIHKSLEGTPTLVLVIPLRYEHSMVNTVDIDDIENLSKAVFYFLKSLTEEKIKEFGFGVNLYEENR